MQIFNQVLDWVQTCPSEFNMERWDCGTTMCIGGKLSRLAFGHTDAVSVDVLEYLADIDPRYIGEIQEAMSCVYDYRCTDALDLFFVWQEESPEKTIEVLQRLAGYERTRDAIH